MSWFVHPFLTEGWCPGKQLLHNMATSMNLGHLPVHLGISEKGRGNNPALLLVYFHLVVPTS